MPSFGDGFVVYYWVKRTTHKKQTLKQTFQTVLLLCVLLMFFGSCDELYQSDKTIAHTDSKYGAILRISEPEFVGSLFPHHISDDGTARISAQIYEGLFKLNPKTLALENCLIKTYSIDQNGTRYTFELKDSVFFHQDKCFGTDRLRKLVSDDVIYSFTKLCEYSDGNVAFSVFHDLVLGADAYYQATKSNDTTVQSVQGLRKISNTKFSIELTHPSTVFPYILAEHQTYIFPKEAILNSYHTKLNKEIGTGPFMLYSITHGKHPHILLKRNPHYHQKDAQGLQLPYLDGLSIRFVPQKTAELDSFVTHKQDAITKLPSELLFDLQEHRDSLGLADLIIEYPEMSIDYLGFNCQSSTFQDLNLRKALAHGIDKKKLIDRALQGEADQPGVHGVTPPVLAKSINYSYQAIRSPEFDLDTAKYFLGQSALGQSGEKNLRLHYAPDGGRNQKIAKELSKQLKENLGIDLVVQIDHLSVFNFALGRGTADFFLSSWFFEYPHPQHHLAAFYSRGITFLPEQNSFPNVFRYVNEEFNRNYLLGFESASKNQALAHFAEAEKILLQDAPIIVLDYPENYKAIQPEIGNYPINPIQYTDFRTTHVKAYPTLYPTSK